jgi:hypothetical protein
MVEKRIPRGIRIEETEWKYVLVEKAHLGLLQGKRFYKNFMKR